MRPDVVDAIRSISARFVKLDKLHNVLGKRIAKMLGIPAASPSGAAAGLTPERRLY